MTSDRASVAGVADAAARATTLGERLAALVDAPEDFLPALEIGLVELADPLHERTLRRVSPHVDDFLAVPAPLVRSVEAPIRTALRGSSSATALALAARLERTGIREVRMFARSCVLRALPDEPERTWQVMRRLASRAMDWIEVDWFAHAWAAGVLAEPFRWAELEQLVYSGAAMERRLVGSTLATMTHGSGRGSRAGLAGLAPRAMALIGDLIGDADPAVQKSLAWALRSWEVLAPELVEPFLRAQATVARSERDGHRAWVIRDTLAALPPVLAADLRRELGDVRRRAAAPSTSTAAAVARRFGITTRTPVATGQGERYARARS